MVLLSNLTGQLICWPLYPVLNCLRKGPLQMLGKASALVQTALDVASAKVA